MTTEQVKIADRQADFIQEMIQSGRYGDIHEVVRASVLLLEERIAYEEQQKEKLRSMLDEAFAGGVVKETFEEIWDAAEARQLGENA